MIAFPMTLFAQKFAVINTQGLVESLPEYKEAQEKLETVAKQYQETFDKLREEFGKKFEEFQALDANTTETIKELRTKELQELDTKMQQFQQTAAQDIQRQQQQLLAPIQEKVLKAVQSVGSEGGYTFVFEDGVPLYVGADVTDITESVKARLAK